MLFDNDERERHTARAIKRLSDHVDRLMLQLSQAEVVPADFPFGQLASAKADVAAIFEDWKSFGLSSPWWHHKYHDEPSTPSRPS